MNSSHAHHGSHEADPMHARFVPLHDAPRERPIYARSLVIFSLLGALVGGVILGWLSYAVAEGGMPIPGLGQFAAAGWGVATFVGVGIGASLGGLTGGLVALLRMPRAEKSKGQHEHAR